MHELLPDHLSTAIYPERDSALYAWRQDLPPDVSEPTTSSHQKIWDKPTVESLFNSLLAACSEEEGKARLLAASSRESGAWLNPPPISSLGLRMSNNTIQVATALRVGAPICQPHTCTHCGKDVDCFARHGLSCRFSQGRLPRHYSINNIIYHSLEAAKIPTRLEPSGLCHSDGNRPDGITMVPWSQGKYPVWDATCVDTYCQSHQHRASQVPGGCSNPC